MASYGLLLAAAAITAVSGSRVSWMFQHRSLAASTLEIRTVPSIGSTDPVTGVVNGLTPSQYVVVIYAVDSSGAWWGAKYFRTVTYPLAADGSFSTDQWASGAATDNVVANLYVAVVPASYNVVNGHVWGNTNTIPTALQAAQVAGIMLVRPPAGSVWVPAATAGPNVSPAPAASPAAASPSSAATPAASTASSASAAATPSTVAASPSSAAAAPVPSNAAAPAASGSGSPAPSNAAQVPSSPGTGGAAGTHPLAKIAGLLRNDTSKIAQLVGAIDNSALSGANFKIAVFMTNDGLVWVDAIEIAFRPLFAVNATGGFAVPLVYPLWRFVRVVIVPSSLDFSTTVAGQETGMYPQVVQSALASSTLDTSTGKVTVDSSATAPVQGAPSSSGSGSSSGSPIPAWGIAVIVVGGCIFIAGVGLATGLAVRRHRQMQRQTDVNVVVVKNPSRRESITAPLAASAPPAATGIDSKVMPQ